jgi:hypothetical protein
MSAIAEQTMVSPTALDRMRERAVSDYLAVSRNVGVYASTLDYLAAEERAWDRLQATIDRARRVEDSDLS